MGYQFCGQLPKVKFCVENCLNCPTRNRKPWNYFTHTDVWILLTGFATTATVLTLRAALTTPLSEL